MWGRALLTIVQAAMHLQTKIAPHGAIQMLVPGTGLEPVRLAARDFRTTSSFDATRLPSYNKNVVYQMLLGPIR